MKRNRQIFANKLRTKMTVSKAVLLHTPPAVSTACVTCLLAPLWSTNVKFLSSFGHKHQPNLLPQVAACHRTGSGWNGGERADCGRESAPGHGDSVANVRSEPPWRVMFFGSDNFSVASLKALHQCKNESGKVIDRLHVVCPESKYIKRRGRTRVISPILQYCNDYDLATIPWPVREEVKGYDLGVLSSFGHLVPEHIIRSFPYGIINVHPSLLPRWRGASPITHAILEGDRMTGVSIMTIRPKKFDVGPILLQESVSIPERSTTESLQEILACRGADMMLKVLKDLPTYIEKAMPQANEGVTLCGKITASKAIVDWNKTSVEIDRLYRAIGVQHPLGTSWHGNQVRLGLMSDPQNMEAMDINVPSAVPGDIHYDKANQKICVKCGDGWVSFGDVTLKKKMTAQDFYNGYLSGKPNTRHCFV